MAVGRITLGDGRERYMEGKGRKGDRRRGRKRGEGEGEREEKEKEWACVCVMCVLFQVICCWSMCVVLGCVSDMCHADGENLCDVCCVRYFFVWCRWQGTPNVPTKCRN